MLGLGLGVATNSKDGDKKMARRWQSHIKLGHLGYWSLAIFFAVLLLAIINAVGAGFQEYDFFTNWNTAKYYDGDPAWFLSHWNYYCFAMALINFTVSFGPAIIVFLIYRKITPEVVLLLVAGICGFITWILVEDLTAHLLYGQDPAGDWNDWIFQSRIQLAANYWLPTFYLIIIFLVVTILLVYAFKGKGWGRRRRK